jgi:hypothetical protein
VVWRSESRNYEEKLRMVWQRNELAAAAGISCDIIPFRYSVSRGIFVPFWEFGRKAPPFANGAKGRALKSMVRACALKLPPPV